MFNFLNRTVMIVVCTLSSLDSVVAQPFTNLNFDSATLNGGFLASDVVPGWSFTPPRDFVFTSPNLSSLPQAYLANHTEPGSAPPLSGAYSIAMQAGEVPLNPEWTMFGSAGIAIHQAALVPATAQSIRFRATSPDPYFKHFSNSPLLPEPMVYPQDLLLAWNLSVGGHSYPLYRLPDGFWGMNIPGQAGQVSDLMFAMNEVYYLGPLDWPLAIFDDISFSTEAIVPEPSSLATLSLASMTIVLGARWRRRLSSRGAARGKKRGHSEFLGGASFRDDSQKDGGVPRK